MKAYSTRIIQESGERCLPTTAKPTRVPRQVMINLEALLIENNVDTVLIDASD